MGVSIHQGPCFGVVVSGILLFWVHTSPSIFH